MCRGQSPPQDLSWSCFRPRPLCSSTIDSTRVSSDHLAWPPTMHGELESGLAILAAYSPKTWLLFETIESIKRKDCENKIRIPDKHHSSFHASARRTRKSWQKIKWLTAGEQQTQRFLGNIRLYQAEILSELLMLLV